MLLSYKQYPNRKLNTMRKLLFIFFLFPFFTNAQEVLIIQGSANDLYLNHTTAAKENFYSVGRMYNVSPKEMAPYNNLTLDNGINIGQVIKIPLRSANFTQNQSPAEDEVAVPVYHKLGSKETLYQLSIRYNKVPVETLKAWNRIQGDAVNTGQDIIIGYLQVKKDQSALASKSTEIISDKKLSRKEKAALAKKESNTSPIVPVSQPLIIPQRTEETVQTVPEVSNRSAKNFKGGIFKSLFENTGKEETGEAGVFKSTSGWEDGKYYCLHNAAPQGAVVKITNPSNGKVIYAKVLDVMPDLGQNSGLALRLSNAAADALGAGMANFTCTINY